MFTDDKFKLKYSMDKRGKNKKHLISDDYKKFYRLSDDEGDNKEENAKEPAKKNDQIDEPESQHSEAKEHDADSDVEGEDTDEEVDKEGTPGPAVASKLTHKIGYHRGQNVASDDESSSSSSSSESEESDEEDDVEVDHEWGELDKDAPQIENVTRRIAICNADWDRINAQDLLVLLNSFKRATGAIHFVRIYYSKFGEERLQVEERKGPTEFIFGKATKVEEIGGQEDDDGDANEKGEAGDSEDENEEDGGEGTDSAAIEKLRTYQLERLKYFYAIVEFDCAETAEVVYNELDGMEYETSSTTLDIRYVPEEMDFDDVKLKEECTSMPNSTSYKAPNFINTALQQSEVTLTWDETDHKRQSAFDRAFDKDHEDDLKAYLASSSEEEEEEDETVNLIDENMKADEKINKYKDLLSSLAKDKEEDIEMEVTWDPSLKSTTENLIKNKQSGGKAGNLTANEAGVPSSGEEEEVHSGDSADLLADDSEAEEKAKADSSKDKYKKWKKKRMAKKEAALSKLSEDTSNLELLMVDMEKDGGSKKHFSYKEIVDNYNKKGRKSADVPEKGDSFKVRCHKVLSI